MVMVGISGDIISERLERLYRLLFHVVVVNFMLETIKNDKLLYL